MSKLSSWFCKHCGQVFASDGWTVSHIHDGVEYPCQQISEAVANSRLPYVKKYEKPGGEKSDMPEDKPQETEKNFAKTGS